MSMTGLLLRLSERKNVTWPAVLAIAAPLLAGIMLRLYILPTGRMPFEADEAIFYLMARHILNGARPLYFYGEAYGAATDSYLIALFYAFLGDTIAVGRLVQSLEYFAGVGFTYLLARRLMPGARLGPPAVLWLMAIPPLLISTWTTPALLYAVVIGLGSLLTYLGYRLLWEDAGRLWRWVLFGAVAGLSFWTFGILVVFMLPLFGLFLWQFDRRRWPVYLLSALAFFLTSLPWWLQAIAGLQVVYDPGQPAVVSPLSIRLLGFFGLLLPAFLGFREPWSPQFFWLPLAPALLVFYLAAVVYALPWLRRRDPAAPALEPIGWLLLAGQGLAWLVLYFGTRFSFDPTGRYILPLYPALFITAGLFLERLYRWRAWLAVLLLAGLVTYNLAAHVRAVQTVPPGIIAQTHPLLQFGNAYDQELIDFVAAHGGRGYSHHWISFKIAFQSREQVILVSHLPYLPDLRWNPRDDRYPPYAQAVAASPERVYVTHREPNLEAFLQAAFAERGVTYRLRDIGPYRVYYDFSAKLTPAEIGLGAARPR